jgi:hypothetical protein
MRCSGIAIKRVLADAAYDPHDNFDVLRRHGIEAGIRTAHDASMRVSGHTFARSMAVKERKALGEEEWGARYAYSLRWMVEYVFSAVKRTLGPEVRSRRRDLMLSEAESKFWVWNSMRRMDLCN